LEVVLVEALLLLLLAGELKIIDFFKFTEV
jgi:hypothetical protein